MSRHTGEYGCVQLVGPITTLFRVLFIHTGARSARLDNQEILFDILKDLSAKFHSNRTCSQKDLVEDICNIAAVLEDSGLVGAGTSDENHVCICLCDTNTGITQYAALLGTSVRTPSKALPFLMKDHNVSPILVGPEADKYYQRLKFTAEQLPTDMLLSIPRKGLTDTIGLITFDPAKGLIVGLTSSTRPSTANRGRIPPSCLPHVGLAIKPCQSGNYYLCGLCTGFTDSMLLGHITVEDLLYKLPLSKEHQNNLVLNPLPVANPHVDFFVLAVESSFASNHPPKLFTSCALGGEAFIYSWGATTDTKILSII